MSRLLDHLGRPIRRPAAGARAYYSAASPWGHPSRSIQWGTLEDPDRDLAKFTRTELARKARDLMKNSLVIPGIVERMVTYIVGDGLMPMPNSSDPAWNAEVTPQLREALDRLDHYEIADWTELQEIAARAALVDGDALALLTTRDGRPTTQLIESHLITFATNKAAPAKSEEPDGVTVRDGAAVTYHVQGGKPIPADSASLIYFPRRAPQHRGVTLLANMINTGIDVEDILALEKTAVKEAAKWTDVIKTASGEDEPEGYAAASDDTGAVLGHYRSIFGPEARLLRPGDDLAPYPQTRPSPAWTGFIDFLCQTLCLAANLPPSVLLQIKVGGADTRRDMAIAHRVIVRYQAKLAHRLTPLVHHVLATMPEPKPADWRRVNWQLPKALTVDAGREAKSDRDDLAFGCLTFREYFGRWGQDWKEELSQRAEELVYVRELAAARGLEPDEIIHATEAKTAEAPPAAAPPQE